MLEANNIVYNKIIITDFLVQTNNKLTNISEYPNRIGVVWQIIGIRGQKANSFKLIAVTNRCS